MRTLINASGANTSSPIRIAVEDLPATVVVKGLAGAETVDVQVSVSGDPDAAADFVDYYKDGTQVQLTTTNTALSIDATGLYRFDVPAAAGTVTLSWKRAGDDS